MGKPFDINDAKWYPLISAGDRCQGGAEDPVYDDAVDIGCVQKCSWTEEKIEAESNGDGGVCARVSKIKELGFTIQHAGLAPELIVALRGATAADFVEGLVNGVVTDVTCLDVRPRGAVIVQSLNHDLAGDVHIVIWNGEIMNGPGGEFASEAFYDSTFEGKADKSLFEGCCKWYRIIEHDAITDIPTIFPGEDTY